MLAIYVPRSPCIIDAATQMPRGQTNSNIELVTIVAIYTVSSSSLDQGGTLAEIEPAMQAGW